MTTPPGGDRKAPGGGRKHVRPLALGHSGAVWSYRETRRRKAGAGARVVARALTRAGLVAAFAVAGVASAQPAVAGAPGRGVAVAGARAEPVFRFSAVELSPSLRRRISGSSWRPGCPVGLDDLRYLRIGHWGFDGRVHVGKMVVGAAAVGAVRRAFATLFRARFPIRRMRLVDDYGASDFASIEADNTSAFNCRRATGQTRWSEHAYGRAIDVNPIENPYVYPNGTTVHRASRPYLDRSRHRRGMATPGGVLLRAFARVGWGWGGTWRGAKDFQHFSSSGR